MIEGLVLGRPQPLGDRFIPFLAVGEFRIDVEDDAAKVEQAVPNDLADGEAGERHVDFPGHGARTFERFKRGHASYLGNAKRRC